MSIIKNIQINCDKQKGNFRKIILPNQWKMTGQCLLGSGVVFPNPTIFVEKRWIWMNYRSCAFKLSVQLVHSLYNMVLLVNFAHAKPFCGLQLVKNYISKREIKFDIDCYLLSKFWNCKNRSSIVPKMGSLHKLEMWQQW